MKFAAPLIALAAAATLDINQKVYIENQPVVGDGAGEGALNECRAFAPQFVSNPDAPEVKVCGTGVKIDVYLRGRCADFPGGAHWTIGSCDKGADSATCVSMGPASDARIGAAQSYKVTQC